MKGAGIFLIGALLCFMFMSWVISEDDGIVFISHSGDQLQINRKNINYLLVPCSQTKCN